ncbi:MAG: hypothetical protein IKH60_05900 [Bacteroidales bacterium]|jgi:ribosome maturation factor RimP|nr:hypothetical protein [Bacteroidales bacterium]
MERTELQKVLDAAALERGCSVAALSFDEDDNVIDVTITKDGGAVNLGDCEYVHRAVLAAFDRDVEDYALTVGSAGISGAEADALLKDMEEEK